MTGVFIPKFSFVLLRALGSNCDFVLISCAISSANRPADEKERRAD